MIQISALLTCFNRKETTLHCLRQLFKQSGINQIFILKIYLVDDGSTDGTGAAILKEFPMVNLLYGTGNLYWNRGMHMAWSAASKGDNDHYLWVNDDTYLFQNTIVNLLEASFQKNNKAIICGTTCSSSDYTKTTYGGIGLDGKFMTPDGTIQKCDHFVGNCVLIPHSVFNILGPLDPFFHHAIGDVDYGLRAKKRGIESFITPDFIGVCEQHDTLPTWCLAERPFNERIKSLYSPLGNSHPYYYFVFIKRHYGLFKAVKNYLTIHLRVTIPKLWND